MKQWNVLKMVDYLSMVQKQKSEKSKLDSIEFRLIDPKFNEKSGNFDYALFKNKVGRKEETRVLRLFRIKSVPELIRKEQNNHIEFKNILNQFGKKNISFVTLYAYKPGKNPAICYGVLAENTEGKLENTLQESEYYAKALELKFLTAFHNIEIAPVTFHEDWIFDSFHYHHLTIARGVPKPDTSLGLQSGSSPYSSPVETEKQVSEIVLKGATGMINTGQSEGFPFLLYSVFDKLDKKETIRAFNKVQNMLGMISSSKILSVSESENFSFPMIFGFGFDAMFGHAHSQTMGMSEGHGTSDSVTNTLTDGNSHAVGNNETSGVSDGTSNQTSTQESQSHTQGKNAGINYIGNFGSNESNAIQTGNGVSDGQNHTDSHQLGSSETNQTSHSAAHANAHGVQDNVSKTNSQGDTSSSGQGHNNNIGAGVSAGDSTGINRMQFDQFFQTAEEIYSLYLQRYNQSLREDMFDYRMFILTPDKETKIYMEELIKQAYVDANSPLPLRIESLTPEQENILIRYARAMKKPEALESRAAIVDKYRYSTHVTTSECTAFSLPQINLAGYNSSFEAIPQSVTFFGEMPLGAKIGKQINPIVNVLSPYFYQLTLEMIKQHILIAGATGQGKTYFNNRFIAEIHNTFDVNVLIFDWFTNYRSLPGALKDKRKFRFNSFSDLRPVSVNLLRTPKGTSDFEWAAILSEILCLTLGLGDRSFRIITDVIASVKEMKPDPTMEDLIDGIMAEKNKRNREYMESGERMPFNEQQTFSSMYERLKTWKNKLHPVYKTMCQGPFTPIEDLVDGSFVHLIECKNLPKDVRPFFINALTAYIFYYAKNGRQQLDKPTFLFFEEAHTLLSQQTGEEPLKVGETIYETINREARNCNLFISYICQSPEKLPELIIDNLPLRFIFQFPSDEGKNMMVSAAGRDPVRLDVNLKNWISKLPRGTCLIRNSKYDHVKDGEFAMIKVSPTYVEKISDEYFKKILNDLPKSI